MQCDCRFFDFCFVLFLPWIGQKEKKKDSTDKLRLKYLETLFPLRPKAVAVMSRQDKIITSQKCSPAPPPSYLPIAVRTGNAEKCSAVRTYIGNSSPPALLSCPAAFLCICVCVRARNGVLRRCQLSSLTFVSLTCSSATVGGEKKKCHHEI